MYEEEWKQKNKILSQPEMSILNDTNYPLNQSSTENI